MYLHQYSVTLILKEERVKKILLMVFGSHLGTKGKWLGSSMA